MTKEEQQKKLDISLTFILQLHEVMLRFITEDIDNPALKHIMKKEFKGLFAQSKKLDKEFRKYINQDKRFDDPEELFDSEADYIYDLIKATYGLNNHSKWDRAIAVVKNIANGVNQ
ncbi:MAG: hypothetical protein ACOWWH_12435 [Eubacteriaceae bacterium]